MQCRSYRRSKCAYHIVDTAVSAADADNLECKVEIRDMLVRLSCSASKCIGQSCFTSVCCATHKFAQHVLELVSNGRLLANEQALGQIHSSYVLL
jgi:hypothetical protein